MIVFFKRDIPTIIVMFGLIFVPYVKVAVAGQLLSAHTSILEICNRTGHEVQLAMIFEHHWKRGKPPTFPAKGWYSYSPGECGNLYFGKIFGIMSIMRKSDDGTLVSMYGNDVPIGDIQVGIDSMAQFSVEEFCLDDASISGYRNSIWDYSECRKGETKYPFSVMFSSGNGGTYTIVLQ